MVLSAPPLTHLCRLAAEFPAWTSQRAPIQKFAKPEWLIAIACKVRSPPVLHLLTLSSPGVPFISRRVDDVDTMISNVKT